MKTCKKRYDAGGGLITTCERPKAHKGECGPYKHKLIDQEATRLLAGDAITFLVPERSIARNGYVVGRDSARVGAVSVQLVGDPFPVGVLPANLKKGHNAKMAKTEAPDRKEMRKTAKKLGILEWEGMTEKQLAAEIKLTLAVAPAKTNGKAKTVKVPRGETKADKGEPVTPSQKAKAEKKGKSTPKTKAKKTAPKSKPKPADESREVAENGNPFRVGSNAYKHTELLIKGGLRSKIIERLLKQIEFKPWGGKKAPKKAADLAATMDKRVLMTAHQLQHLYGFTIVICGRGPEKSTMQAFPPDVKVPSALAAKASLINGVKPGAIIKPKTKAVKSGKVKPVASKKSKTKAVVKKASKPKVAKKTATKATKTAAKSKKK